MTHWRDPTEYKRDAIRVTIIIVIVSTAFRFVEPMWSSHGFRESDIAKSMLEEASQWHMTSIQDQNAQSKNQHAVTASAYLHAARHILNDVNLERISGIDIHELDSSIQHMQKTSIREMHRQCPRLKPAIKPGGSKPRGRAEGVSARVL